MMQMISGNHARGKASFADPGEAWDFKMERQLDGAKTRMWEKTAVQLGVAVLCSPRSIYVSWDYSQ